MTEVTYRDAIIRGIGDALTADEDVFFIGEDVGAAGGAFKLSAGLLDQFGPRRVRDTPISEQAIVGAAIGAAVQGLRPLAEIMFADFAGVCFDQIANELAKYRYMTGGQVSVPVTIRMVNGAGTGFAAQHSQPAENWFLNVPGLKIVVPATPGDAYGLLRAAIEDPDPVLVFEHKALFNVKGPLPDGPLELGKAEVVRAGEHVTVVTTQQMRHRAIEAAALLEAENISVEVIDLRCLVPLDVPTVIESLERTNRLVVAQEASVGGSWGASLIATILQTHFETLDAPPRLVCAPDTPVPYAGVLEAEWVPSVTAVAQAIRETVAF